MEPARFRQQSSLGRKQGRTQRPAVREATSRFGGFLAPSIPRQPSISTYDRPVVAHDRNAADAVDTLPKRDIAVIGLWHLGSVTAAGWSHVGRPVLAWDPEPELRAAMQ